MSHKSPVEKAAVRRQPAKPAVASRADLRKSPERLIAKIDAKRGDNSLGAALRAGTLVRKMRREAGFSQKALADTLGVSQARVSEIEAGAGTQGPTWAIMERIAIACDCELGLVRAAPGYPGLIDSPLISSAGKDPVFVEVSAVHETYGAAVFHQIPYVMPGLKSDRLGSAVPNPLSPFATFDMRGMTGGQFAVGPLFDSVRTRNVDVPDE
ncbi:MAG TPA: helix-turn-helix transcriptional regulator [Allosphingosinicella sp.]|nr:helix-turn-helix transcriptional regulator [Allosphingosinicella sp.]